MKKLLAFLLIFVMVFALVACGSDETSQEESSKEVSSNDAGTSSNEEESSEPVEESSKPVEESSEPVEESSEDIDPVPTFLPNNYVYVDGIISTMTAASASSIRLTAINEKPAYGDVVLFTYSLLQQTIKKDGETYEDFAILVVEYDGDAFKYLKKEIIPVDSDKDKSAIAIPEDGYVVVIHEARASEIAKLDLIKNDVAIYAAGIQTKEIYWELNKTDTPFDLDGVIGPEWDSYLIEEIDETNTNWDYSQFVGSDYDRQAKLFASYDDKNFYLALIVDSSSCTFLKNISDSTKGNMYLAESIQMNFLNQSSQSEEVLEHYNNHIDQFLTSNDKLRQYGFSGSDEGKTYTNIWMGGTHTDFTGTAVVVRDEANQTTTYEISIPWEELNVEDINNIGEVSFSISLNSYVDGVKMQCVRMRDGGGIIGINDFTKMPVVTVK